MFKFKLTKKKSPSVLHIRISSTSTEFSLTYDPTHDYYLLGSSGVFYTHKEIKKHIEGSWTLLSYEE